MSHSPQLIGLVERAKDVFDRIIIALSSDIFYSYFKDEARLADFRQIKIEPLTLSQQEKLIRKRLELSESTQPVTDGFVDQVENQINSVIISNKILPRYPFYVLSILQSYEAYMPTNMSVTSYGHCYHVLIVANLMLAGISKTDDDVNACFNLAENLAFAIYEHRQEQTNKSFDMSVFLVDYNERFFIKDSIINRLKHHPYGLIDDDGTFRAEYMYYYFLGKFLAGNGREGMSVINLMCEHSHRESNYLTLLFTIHHTNDNSIIDEILLRTMCTLDSVQPAVLDRPETARFRSIVEGLPENILSKGSVGEARHREREAQDDNVDLAINTPNDSDEISPVNAIYSVLRNNKIMGQVLRNKHGNLERSQIQVIIETIADSGLRLVNWALENEDEIARTARYLKSKNPEWDTASIKQALRFLSFVWTMVNVEQIAEAISVPEIKEAVNAVVDQRSTPAFDLIAYFNQLNIAKTLTQVERDKLYSLFKKHDDIFVQRVLSMRTQYYMNTHRSKAQVEQSICSLLGVKYIPRLTGTA